MTTGRLPWTLALLKPDAVANPIVLRWLNEAIFQSGLEITAGCRLELSPAMASQLYASHQQKFYYERLVRHVCSGYSFSF
jgi:nucleoside diphosphate kinase